MTTDGGFNLDDLITEFGAFYRDNGQGEADIRKRLMFTDEFSKFFKKVPNVGTHYEGVQIFSTEVLQGFRKDFKSKGTGSFKTWKQRLGEFKIDKSESPDDYRGYWTGFLADLNEQDRTKWPIIRFIIENVLIPQAEEDFVKEVAYWGYQYTGIGTEAVNQNGTSRVTATTVNKLKANTSMDGVRLQMVKMKAANRLNEITMGTWATDASDFVGEIEEFVKQIPVLLRKKIDYLFMSPEKASLYRLGVQDKYNVNYKQTADLDTIFDSQIKIVGVDAMDGSEKVWGTPALNRVKPTRADQKSRFDTQKDKRMVNLLNDWSLLLTFNQPELIVTSEHENTIEDEEVESGGRYETTVAA